MPAPRENPPAITGPSFLGLNKSDGPVLSSDEPRRSSYERADYLLDDDDEEPKGGWGKWVLVLVALVLAAGFGYLRWKQGGFDWVMGGNKPAATEQSSQNPADSGSAPPPATNSSSPAPANTASPAPSPAAANNSPNTPASDNANPTPPAAQPAPPAANTAPNDSARPSPDPMPAATNTAPAPSSKAAQSNDNTSDTDSEATAPAAKPAPAIQKPRKPTPITPADNTAEAERYIYGNGVRQDCDRGMRMLKSAAESNPKAMVSMGALYSTGTCAPRDLPTAYRWFALALHKQPDSQVLQDDLQKLWGQMTPPERQLAIKLSQ
jgi:hypothetical protein